MIKPYLRWTRAGAIAAGLFLLLASVAFAWVFYSATTNPADSGESGILLLPFTLPWIMLLPGAWVGPLTGLGSIIFNALLVYLVFGGIRARRIQKD